MLPFSHTWLPFIYLYTAGGLLLAAGIVITLKTGALRLDRKHHQRWLGLLIFGYFWYFAMHGLLNLVALNHTGLAEILGVLFLVLTLIGALILKAWMKAKS